MISHINDFSSKNSMLKIKKLWVSLKSIRHYQNFKIGWESNKTKKLGFKEQLLKFNTQIL